jgi:hypothetical protein
MTGCSIRKFFHKNPNFHPHKIGVVQELSNHDMANCSIEVEHFIGILANNLITLMTDKAHSHLSGQVNQQIFADGKRKIHSSSINNTRKHGEAGTGKSVSKVGRVCMQ